MIEWRNIPITVQLREINHTYVMPRFPASQTAKQSLDIISAIDYVRFSLKAHKQVKRPLFTEYVHSEKNRH